MPIEFAETLLDPQALFRPVAAWLSRYGNARRNRSALVYVQDGVRRTAPSEDELTSAA